MALVGELVHVMYPSTLSAVMVVATGPATRKNCAPWAATAPSAEQAPTPKVAMPTQSAPQHTRPAFKPEVAAAPIKVTHAVELKKPTAANSSLFDDIH